MKLFQLINSKKQFFVLLFSNLLVQLGITYWFMERTTTIKNKWPLIIAVFIILFIMLLVPLPKIVKFLLFCVFSSIFGILFSTLKQTNGQQLIDLAIKSALSIFGFMFVIGILLITSGINITGPLGPILFWSLLALIIARLVFVSGLNMPNSNKYLSYIGILIFSIYIVYDTNIILQRNYSGDFIEASMDYYLDIINLFTNSLDSTN
jgi:protein lifeguard